MVDLPLNAYNMSAETLSAPSAPSRKRSSTSELEPINAPHARKRRKQDSHHHEVRYKQSVPATTAFDQKDIHAMLTRSLAMTLEAVGYHGAEPEALESFRAQVEEYLEHTLLAVHRSMLSSRRTQPTPQDIIHAMSLRELSSSALEPYLDNFIPPQQLQPSLERRSPEPAPPLPLSGLLGASLSGEGDKAASTYVPPHFPEFPSKHTYQATPDYSQREHDPQRIRERATEEARLGEESLRRLLAAQSTSKSTAGGQVLKKSERKKERDELWAATMAVAADNVTWEKAKEKENSIPDDDLEIVLEEELNPRRSAARTKASPSRPGLGAVVNFERTYWRKGRSSGLRAATRPSPDGGTAGDGVAGADREILSD